MKVEAEARFKQISSAVERLTAKEVDADEEFESHMEDMAEVFTFFTAFMNAQHAGMFGRQGVRFGGACGFPGPSSTFGIFVKPEMAGNFTSSVPPPFGCGLILLLISLMI